MEEANLRLTFDVADYVDFYSSLEHATNLGRMFRPDQEPLLPNWRWLPVAYHGRAGSVVVSGTDVVRPRGQRKAPDEDAPTFGPSRRLDFELELVAVFRPCSVSVPVEAFADHVFGVACRTTGAATSRPGSTCPGPNGQASRPPPGLVTPLALPRTPASRRRGRTAAARSSRRRARLALDIALEAELNGRALSRGNARTLYWTLPQQLAHATSNGGRLRTGDLMASGTISGAEPGS